MGRTTAEAAWRVSRHWWFMEAMGKTIAEAVRCLMSVGADWCGSMCVCMGLCLPF
jgi:hypothetical protein